MTREEAIELKAAVGRLMYSDNKDIRDYNALIDFIDTALRPVSRERVENVWRAHWNESTHLGGFVYCSRCGYNALEANNYTFCPKCGSPFTDEAVEMVMERLEALHENP